MNEIYRVNLLTKKKNDIVTIKRVEDTQIVLQYLTDNDLYIGDEIEIISLIDHVIVLKGQSKKKLTREIAAKIYVE